MGIALNLKRKRPYKVSFVWSNEKELQTVFFILIGPASSLFYNYDDFFPQWKVFILKHVPVLLNIRRSKKKEIAIGQWRWNFTTLIQCHCA